MNWTPPIAMAQQTNKKTLHNIQEFSSICFIKSSLEVCFCFMCTIIHDFEGPCQLNSLGMIFHLNFSSSFYLKWFQYDFKLFEIIGNDFKIFEIIWMKLCTWNNFRLFPLEFQFILRLSGRNGTWKAFPASLFPLQPPHHPSRPSAPPTTPPTCPLPPCQPPPSPCPPPGPPPPCSTLSSSSPACLSARHLPPHPSTVTPPSRGRLAHIRHIILKR